MFDDILVHIEVMQLHKKPTKQQLFDDPEKYGCPAIIRNDHSFDIKTEEEQQRYEQFKYVTETKVYDEDIRINIWKDGSVEINIAGNISVLRGFNCRVNLEDHR